MGDQPPIESQPTISTHVLDTERGRPASGVAVSLFGPDGRLAGQATTDEDGRVRRLLETALMPGDYRIEFELEAELRFHLDQLIQEKISSGMPREEASRHGRAAARRPQGLPEAR